MKDMHMLALQEDIEKEMEKYESYFSPVRTSEEEVTSSLKEIENLASKAKVSVISIRPGEVREEDFFESYLVNLNCEGTMRRLVTFLHAIETASTLFTVERYIISPATAGSRETISARTARHAAMRWQSPVRGELHSRRVECAMWMAHRRSVRSGPRGRLS